MRTVKILTGLSAGVLLALAGGAQAATKTDTFVVSAVVNANCFVAATDMTFPGFDGSADVPGTSNVEVRCTSGAPYDLYLNVGTGGGSFATRELTDGAGPTLAYNLYRDAAHTEIWADNTGLFVSGTGAGLGNPQAIDHTVYGLIPTAGNETVPGGTYSSTIQVTVEY
jgi:spore coat protein U-like protein